MKTILKNDLYDGEKVVLFQDEIGLENRFSTIDEKTGKHTGNKKNSNTALIIALLGLLILAGLFIYQNIKEYE